MVHLLLFYRIILYSFGFTILVIVLLKYLVTRNFIIRAFLFFWSSMTITAAGYVIDFYIIKNTDIGMYSFAYIVMQIGALLISVSLPYFVHKIFNIKKKYALYFFDIICFPLLICISIPISSEWTQSIVDFVMITVVVSNLYSFIVSLISIVKLKSLKDKITGLSFIASFIILFYLLLIIDIFPQNDNGNFLIFPLFYTFTGCFFFIIGYKKFKHNPIDTIPEDFIKKYKLTKRETEIIPLLIDGIKYRDIAEKLFISLNTVNTHILHIYEKTNTNSKVQLRKSISSFL